jgi:hypothetical protein
MKKLMTISLVAVLALPAWTTTRTTTTAYEDTTPVMDTDMESNSEMIEAQEARPFEEIEENSLTGEEFDFAPKAKEQRMEEINAEDVVNYSDRTRTDRARKALNTGSDASDDN